MIAEIKQAVNTHYDLNRSSGNQIHVDEYTQIEAFIENYPSNWVTNLRNELSYYIAPFNLRLLYYPFLWVPDEYRHGNEFQIRLLRELHSDILDIPVISGSVPGGVQRLTSPRIKEETSIKSKIFDQARRLPYPIYLRLRYWYLMYQNSQNKTTPAEADLRKFYLDRLRNSLYNSDFDFEEFYGSLGTLNRFVLYDFGIDRLGYGSVSRDKNQ